MTFRYLCKKCMFNANNFNDIKRHLNKKNLCKKNIDSINYSDDLLLILSLLPYQDNDNEIIEKLNYLKNSDIIFKNKNKLFNDIFIVEKNKSKNCIYCDKEFNKISDLKEHILVKCFFDELQKENKINKINKNITINNNSTTEYNLENSLNTTNNINNINNINIYLEIKSPIPFDNEWDLSKINRDYLTFSKFMYSKLLEEILKNEINLNVIIDKNNDSGIVYKNNIDKYIQMKLKDIVDNTMDKLKKHLLDINNSFTDNILQEFIDMSKNIIENKYDTYKNNKDIQNSVKEIISNIYEEKKEEAICISNNFHNEIIKNIHKGY